MRLEMDFWKEGSLPPFTNQQGEAAPLHFIRDQIGSYVFTKDLDGCYTYAEKEGKAINAIASTGEPRIYWSVKLPLYNQKGEITGLCEISTEISPK
ncbi:MAG: hypothetical protein ACYCT9_07490 [Leptospirillum sp.]|jgi:hypothetical protein